jgi:hypothetical protein
MQTDFMGRLGRWRLGVMVHGPRDLRRDVLIEGAAQEHVQDLTAIADPEDR